MASLNLNYNKTKIFKLVSYSTNEVYFDCTITSLHKRLLTYQSDYRHYKRYKDYYRDVYEIIKHGNCRIELVENFPCNSRYEARKRLKEIQEEYNNSDINCYTTLD